MEYQLAELLVKMQQHIPSQLVSESCQESFVQRLAHLGNLHAPLYGFESDLTRTGPEADFSCFIPAWQPVISLLQSQLSSRSSAAGPVTVPGEINGKPINGVWLGYKTKARSQTAALPEILYFSGSGESAALAQPEPEVSLQPPLRNLFYDRDFSPDTLQTLADCYLHTKGLAIPGDPGYLPGRSPDALRLQLIFKTTDKLYTYLERIEQQQQLPAIRRVLDKLADSPDFFILHLDLNHRLGSRIGIELRLNGYTTRDFHYFQPRWQQFLDLLKQLDFCLPQKYTALKTWQGRWRDFNDAQLYGYITEKFICHFKIIFQQGEHMAMKCYFGLVHSRL